MLHQIVILYTIIFFQSPISSFVYDLKHLASRFLLLVNIIFLSDFIARYFEAATRKNIICIWFELSVSLAGFRMMEL